MLTLLVVLLIGAAFVGALLGKVPWNVVLAVLALAILAVVLLSIAGDGGIDLDDGALAAARR